MKSLPTATPLAGAVSAIRDLIRIHRRLIGDAIVETELQTTTQAPQISVSPELSVRRGREAVDFYQAAFGATEIYRVGGTDEAEEVVAQLSIGGACFWVSDESPSHKNFSPESLGGSTVRLLLTVQDPHSVVERAVTLGATAVSPVQEEHGWLLGRIEDPFGHQWEIGKPLVDWPPSRSRTHSPYAK